MNPLRDAVSYARQMLAVFPTGPIWPTDLAGVWGGVLLGSADELVRVDQGADRLLRELDPRTTFDMLGDWEQAYGLPDPCTAPPATIDGRRRRLVQLVTMKGSLSKRFLTELAYDLGYDVLLEEFAPATMGVSRCGETMDGADWRWALFVHAPPTALQQAYAGDSYFGERILDFGISSLECVLRRHVPATSLPGLIFGYADPHATFGAAAEWLQPGPASGVAEPMPARPAGATYFLVGSFAAEAFGGSDAAFALIASATRVSVGAATGGGVPRVTVPIAPGAGRCLISIVQTDEGGQRSISVRINGAPAGTATAAGTGALAGD
ncbi:MAG: DUF2313 domain-containing protein, partial [Reyranella sp.]|nr:DUF2313 domain-containing protein [Reyranella sp.]